MTKDGHVVEKYFVKGKKKYFVTLAGTHYCAHGNSLAEAISDALWKDESKRPSLETLKKEIQTAGCDRKITLSEFRILTGACLDGCHTALNNKKLDGSPMTAKEIRDHFPEWGEKLYSILEWQ